MPLPYPKPITPHHEVHGAPLLDIPAVARRLDVCEKTVRRFIARGELRAYRIGRQLRVSEEEYLRFLAAKR
jgi:excisionase family DNA binding protein